MTSTTRTRPYLVLVDDDPSVLAATERDMRARYAKDYEVVSAGSGEEGLELAQELRRRGAEVALFLVDQRMPGMSGLEMLGQVRDLYPSARRVLLTAYSDT